MTNQTKTSKQKEKEERERETDTHTHKQTDRKKHEKTIPHCKIIGQSQQKSCTHLFGIGGTTIVRRKDNKSVVVKAKFFHLLQDLAHPNVQLPHSVPIAEQHNSVHEDRKWLRGSYTDIYSMQFFTAEFPGSVP